MSLNRPFPSSSYVSSSSEVKSLKQILDSGKAWQTEHKTQYQNEELWIDLRNDWITALNETSDSSIEDLKSLYLNLVNVHGVTTAQSGSWHWFIETINKWVL